MEAESRAGRRAGVLLHITSLPSTRGLGTMGSEAYRFVDWLADAGFSVWQVLPLMPPHGDLSPYLGLSSFAGNPRLIDVPSLQKDEELQRSWLGQALRNAQGAEPQHLVRWLETLAQNQGLELLPGGEEYLHDNHFWLPDYAAFMVLRETHGGRFWLEWEARLRNREPTAVEAVLEQDKNLYRAYLLEQYLFDYQWRALKAYANRAGISMFGDAPLYVAHDSADVWVHRQLFQLDADGTATQVAGTPPDLFAQNGQRWGNPVFDWRSMAAEEYRWWVARIKRQLALCDILRIDHFRGLQAYWSIPAGEETAAGGRWVEAPGEALLDTLRRQLGKLPLVAEDLGYITEQVNQLRQQFGLPTMRILQFAFDGSPENPHLPQNTPEHAVAYTGTHDNNTVLGWYAALEPDAQSYVRTTLKMEVHDSILEAMVSTVLQSPAQLAMLPMQDVLGLGSDSRMNKPGTVVGNWRWQFAWTHLQPEVAGRYQDLLGSAGRICSHAGSASS